MSVLLLLVISSLHGYWSVIGVPNVVVIYKFFIHTYIYVLVPLIGLGILHIFKNNHLHFLPQMFYCLLSFNKLIYLHIVQANAKTKFDETVEAHIRLGIDSKRTELVYI